MPKSLFIFGLTSSPKGIMGSMMFFCNSQSGGIEMSLSIILMLIQVFFAVVIGLYFWNLLRNQQTNRSAVDRESKKELEKLRKLRSISLTKPLAEKTRPSSINEIIGQREGLKALK